MFESDLLLPRSSRSGPPSPGVCAQSKWMLLPHDGRLHQWLAGPPDLNSRAQEVHLKSERGIGDEQLPEWPVPPIALLD